MPAPVTGIMRGFRAGRFEHGLGDYGTLVSVFDLSGVRYIEGAPPEWRRWLSPGLSVVLRFATDELSIYSSDHSAALPWTDVDQLAARGPEEPEHRYIDRWRRSGLDILMGRTPGRKVSFSWLAVRLINGSEIIFEVADLLRPDLERLLEEHAG